jgi:hypothetical protein
VESLRKALAKEQEDHAITKKAHVVIKKKYCDLDEKHKKLSYNMALFGIATDIPLRQRRPLLPPLAKVVENAIILI